MNAHGPKLLFSFRGALLGMTLLGGVVALVVACSTETNPAASNAGPSGPTLGGNTCVTPNLGCPCETPGEKIACGKKVTGDLNFIYCYQGTRVCQPNNQWGDCLDGEVQTKSLTRLHTLAGAVPTSCSGGLTSDTISVCTGGKRAGDFCATNADCSNGERICTGSTDSTKKCKNNSECNVLCTEFNGHCNGGTKANQGCNADSDCPSSTCSLAGGGNVCGAFNGICVDGTNDGEACTGAADCPGGGTCTPPKFGVCLGGKLNGKKCKNTKHCKAGGVCSNEGAIGDGGVEAIDPCDPFCNVFSDNAASLVEVGDSGFVFADGGLTPAGCGDGNLVFPESCDDGNTTPGDGCSATCRVEPGFYCPTANAPCLVSVCGNGVTEGTEQCDDTNVDAGAVDRPYDGCFKCQLEVQCPPGGSCTQRCGDGVVMGTETCDDGNTYSGDGCSSSCQTESGVTCTTTTSSLPTSIDVPVIYHDMAADGQGGSPAPTTLHPDFQNNPPHTGYGYACVGSGTTNKTHQGIMADTLAADGEPTAKLPVAGGFNECNAVTINSWYRDVPALNRTILGHYLRLFQSGGPTSSTYIFNSDTDTVTQAKINCGYGTTTTCQSQGGFWPINTEGFGPYQPPSPKNFHFTSEVRFPFTYKGGEVLSFTGDDDVFVYVAGRKVVDLGGIHGALNGSTTLANSMTTVPEGNSFTLTPNQTYEIAVFQAERQTVGSNYKLTLQGFTRATSVCTKNPVPVTFSRDYQAVCKAGSRVVWQVFRWKATVPGGSGDGGADAGDAGAPTNNIVFQAATAETQGALPAAKTDSTVVGVGTATSANSSATDWRFNGWPGTPVPVSATLKAAGQTSQNWLRLYMTFNGTPVLSDWQVLYDCVDAE